MQQRKWLPTLSRHDLELLGKENLPDITNIICHYQDEYVTGKYVNFNGQVMVEINFFRKFGITGIEYPFQGIKYPEIITIEEFEKIKPYAVKGKYDKVGLILHFFETEPPDKEKFTYAFYRSTYKSMRDWVSFQLGNSNLKYLDSVMKFVHKLYSHLDFYQNKDCEKYARYINEICAHPDHAFLLVTGTNRFANRIMYCISDYTTSKNKDEARKELKYLIQELEDMQQNNERHKSDDEYDTRICIIYDNKECHCTSDLRNIIKKLKAIHV